jgi:hypothetical protein
MKKVFLVVALLGLGITFSNAQTQTAVTPQKSEVKVTDQTVPAAEKKDAKCSEKSSTKSCCKKSSASTTNVSGAATVSDKKECTTKEGEAACKKSAAKGKGACCKGHADAGKAEVVAPKQ